MHKKIGIVLGGKSLDVFGECHRAADVIVRPRFWKAAKNGSGQIGGFEIAPRQPCFNNGVLRGFAFVFFCLLGVQRAPLKRDAMGVAFRSIGAGDKVALVFRFVVVFRQLRTIHRQRERAAAFMCELDRIGIEVQARFDVMATLGRPVEMYVLTVVGNGIGRFATAPRLHDEIAILVVTREKIR